MMAKVPTSTCINRDSLAIAIVCDHLKMPPEELHFKSIKALD